MCLVAGYAVYNRLHSGTPEAGFDPMAMGPGQVTVAAVLSREAQEFRDYSGRLRGVEIAEVKPRIEGIIDKVHFEEGAFVKKGDLLFTIDPRPFEAEVKRAEAALRSAKAQAEYSKADFERAVPLMKDEFVTKRDYDTRRNSSHVATAGLAGAEASLRKAQLDLEYTEIRAPIDGRVGRAEITAGNLVQNMPNTPLLTTVVTYTPIYADFNMDEQTYLIYVQAGQTGNDKAKNIPVMVALAGEGAVQYKGFVKIFDNQLDPASGTVRVRAQLDNLDAALIPGMFARIRIGIPSTGPSILIVDRAIKTDQDKKVVLVVDDKNLIEQREVKLGGMVDGMRIITSGLKPGEKIVVNGLHRAMPGMPVAPAVIDMDKATQEVEAAPPQAPAAKQE